MELHHALSADFRVLSKLRSDRFSLYEVVASVRSSHQADTTPGRLRRQQLMRIRRGRTDRHAEAFLDRQPEEATSPLVGYPLRSPGFRCGLVRRLLAL